MKIYKINGNLHESLVAPIVRNTMDKLSNAISIILSLFTLIAL